MPFPTGFDGHGGALKNLELEVQSTRTTLDFNHILNCYLCLQLLRYGIEDIGEDTFLSSDFVQLF